MPKIVRTLVRRMSQAEFGDLAYSVMGCIFEIHRDMGRFFDERIYKRELTHRYPGVQLEVPIEITHKTFKKLQFIDALVEGGAPFELKTVDAITPRHKAQLLNYLLLIELPHGKLVNLKKESVEHEFVNTTLRHEDRVAFGIVDSKWTDEIPGATVFRETLTEILRDWGTGLDLQLYEEALTHFLGGESQVLSKVQVRSRDHTLGYQLMRLAAPLVAFSVTALPHGEIDYENQLRRFIKHTELEAILWANVCLKKIAFIAVAQQKSDRKIYSHKDAQRSSLAKSSLERPLSHFSASESSCLTPNFSI
jgi:GxxExxY protein